MKIALLTIGDELLEGAISNSNAQWASQELWTQGLSFQTHLTVRDDKECIVGALNEVKNTHDMCIISGGLGPTPDDVTVAALSQFLEQPMISDEKQCARLVGKGLPFEKAQRLSLRPKSSESFDNHVGQAPLILGQKSEFRFLALPGVPSEFKGGFNQLMPRILMTESHVHHRQLTFINLGETALVKAWRALGQEDKVQARYLADAPFTHLRLVSKDLTALEASVKDVATKLSSQLIEHDADQRLTSLSEQLNRLGASIATAESCTAGMIAAELGRLSGASSFLQGGVVAYSNDVKIKQLGVSHDIISQFGAVSEPCAAAMARGVCDLLGADVGVSVTGIAGPGGGTNDKPVGTVCFGWSIFGEVRTQTMQFRGDRTSIRIASAVWSLHQARESLRAKTR